MNDIILDYVMKHGVFQPGTDPGSYAGIPFTPEEWLQCVYAFWEENKYAAEQLVHPGVTIWVKPFVVNDTKFLFRCVVFTNDKIADQLWTEACYRNAFSFEARTVFPERS